MKKTQNKTRTSQWRLLTKWLVSGIIGLDLNLERKQWKFWLNFPQKSIIQKICWAFEYCICPGFNPLNICTVGISYYSLFRCPIIYVNQIASERWTKLSTIQITIWLMDHKTIVQVWTIIKQNKPIIQIPTVHLK